MSITISPGNTLTEAEYKNLRLALMTLLEGKGSTPYFDTANPQLITIGIGFNIDGQTNNLRNDVLDAMNLSQTQKDAVKNLFSSPQLTVIRGMPHVTTADKNAQNTALANLFNQAVGMTFVMTESQMTAVFTTIADVKDIAAQGFTGIATPSFERVVLTSLEYNTKYNPPNPNALLGPSLLFALNNTSDPALARAEAWYQIGYNSNSGGNQFKRRIVESRLFGLYANPSSVGCGKQRAPHRSRLVRFVNSPHPTTLTQRRKTAL